MDTGCIPANPDISGIGVRVAIYAQNLLCFLPVILYLIDGTVSVDELAGIQDQSTGVLAIAFTILITTASLAAGRNPTVSNYHAAIILSLSWMNNTSTWIWFILYVHERSGAKYKPVAATWRAWRKILWSPVSILLGASDPTGSGTGPTSQSGERDERKKTRLQNVVKHIRNSPAVKWVVTHLWNSRAVKWVRRFARLILAAPVLTLGSIHLSMMAAIGIWLWRKPADFGKPIDRCIPMLTIFGASVSFNSTPLRIFSLAMYAVVLIPGLNLLPPFAFFLLLHISYNDVRMWIHHSGQDRKGKGKLWYVEGGKTDPTPADTPVYTTFLYVGLICLFAINILLIVDTELTLRHNMHNQSTEERIWGFGQILTVLLLFVPLRDVWLALRNIQNNVQQRFEQAFRTVAEAELAEQDLSSLLRDKADPRKPISGRFGHFLQLAAYHGREKLINLVLHDTTVNAVGGDYGTALQAAAARGHNNIVKHLLEHGANVNLARGDYGTALCAACANGHLDIVKTLLNQLGIEKSQVSEFGTPLHVAILLGKMEIITELVKAGVADCRWRNTALDAVVIAELMGEKEITNLLKKTTLKWKDQQPRYQFSRPLSYYRHRQDDEDRQLYLYQQELHEARRQLQQLVNRDKLSDQGMPMSNPEREGRSQISSVAGCEREGPGAREQQRDRSIYERGREPGGPEDVLEAPFGDGSKKSLDIIVTPR